MRLRGCGALLLFSFNNGMREGEGWRSTVGGGPQLASSPLLLYVGHEMDSEPSTSRFVHC